MSVDLSKAPLAPRPAYVGPILSVQEFYALFEARKAARNAIVSPGIFSDATGEYIPDTDALSVYYRRVARDRTRNRAAARRFKSARQFLDLLQEA